MVVAVLKKFKKQWEVLNDWSLNIDTRSLPHEEILKGDGQTLRHTDAKGYQTVDYLNLRKIRRLLQLGQSDTVYDLGCGKGRVVCVLAQAAINRCVGIEIFPDLCDIARSNADRLRRRRAPIEIRCADVATADLSDGTVYFMFNPFGADTMRTVMDNIQRSLLDKPRTVRIVYANPKVESLIASYAWLKKVADFRTLGGMSVVFYQNVS
jgi:predicted RNA methylase